MSSDESDSEAYGPPLPPAVRDNRGNDHCDPASNSESENSDAFMPELPPHLVKTAGREQHTSNIKSDKSDLQKSSHKEKLQDCASEDSEQGHSNQSQKNSHRTDHSKGKGKQNLESEDDDDVYVPALPPHLLHRKPSTKGDCRTDLSKIKSKDQQNSGVKRPAESDSEDDDDMYGPALPPHLLHKKTSGSESRRNIIGPSLPSGFVPPKEAPTIQEGNQSEEEEEEEQGPVIGPAPPSEKFNEEEHRIRELELRARKMKEKLEGKNVDGGKPLVRESWMLELPEDKPNFCGLGPRQFLRKTPAEKGDRSMWTDTPADKARKAQMRTHEEEEIPETVASSRRDDELTVAVDEYNKSKRAKPLIDQHQKKIKKKELESGPKERRPFSREEDLNVNKFDEAQKSNILKKARQLNDRFSAGNRKFL